MDKRGSGGGDKNTPSTSPPPTITCNAPTNVGDSYTKTGWQRQISNVLTCDSTANCQQSYAQSVTVTSSLTIVNGTTITMTGGVSVSFEEGRKTNSMELAKRCGLTEQN
jgi:hypothetical protein